MMKKLLLSILAVFAILSSYSQTNIFHENFESPSLADSVVSTTGIGGGNNWAITSNLSVSGTNSDSCQVAVGDTSFLTTNSMSTSGYNAVILEFNHICKVEWADAAEVFVSVNNGTSWIKLTQNEYLGNGNFLSASGDKFTAISYINDWQAINPGAVPDNTWWKTEKFDLSSIASNASQVKVRFSLRDGNNTGAIGHYGWIIDDIRLTAATGELIPPSISLKAPLLQDTIYNSGPFDIYAHISDASGIDTAKLIYNINSGANITIGMTWVSDSTYSATIPSMPYNTSICYHIEAIDNSSSANFSSYPSLGCQEIYTLLGPNYVEVGTSATNDSKSPLYIISGTSANKHSNHISIYDASELNFDGDIQSIAWNKANAHGYSYGDAKLRIYLKHTNDTVVNSSSSFTSLLSGATLVYNDTTQNLSTTTGWQTFEFDTTNSFFYNGSDKLMVLVEWYRPLDATGAVNWFHHTATDQAITFYGSVPTPTSTAGTGQRPDIKIAYFPTSRNNDVGLYQYLSPKGKILATSSTEVKVRLKNYGINTLTKSTLNWTLDGASQLPHIWTGSLAQDIVSNDISLGSPVLNTGPHTIKAWTLLPNDSIDENAFNDTIKETFYVCNEILNGTYFIGGGSADFQTLGEVMSILNNCGVSGPVTLKVNPGIYTEQLLFTPNISGLSAQNTLTIESSTGNSSDVTIQFLALSAAEDYVVKVEDIEHFTIKNLTLKALGTDYANVLIFIGEVRNSEVSGNEIISTSYIYSNNATGLRISKGMNSISDNGRVLVSNNAISKGLYGIYLAGYSNNPTIAVQIIDNEIIDFRTLGISSVYTDSMIVDNNTIISSTTASAPKGIFMNYGMGDGELKNNHIELYASGYAPKGIEVSNSTALASNPNQIVNNMISLHGSSTSSVASGIYFGSGAYNKFYYNSISINTASVLSSAIYVGYSSFSSGSNNEFLNNNVAHLNGGFAYEVTSNAVTNSVISVSDYNNFYTSGTILAKWGTNAVSNISGISGLSAISTLDINSKSVDPGFYSATNLHSFAPLLDGAASPISGIVIDFDQSQRDASTPDIGADEFTLSNSDVGVVAILSPLPTDTQNNVVTVEAVIRNFGLAAVTSMNINVQLNANTAVSTSWTGSLIPGAIDTVLLSSVTIPAGNYDLCAYTDLTGDSLNYNDSACVTYFGLPLYDAFVNELVSPESGCNKGLETVSLKIFNLGVDTISSGLTAHYQILGSSNVTSESVSQSILPGGNIIHQFSTNADLTVSGFDSIFDFKMYVTLASDLLKSNDTLRQTVTSYSNLPLPQINDTTINYGSSATLTATSLYPINWYESDTAAVAMASGPSYTTPALIDTTSYWLEASESVPPGDAIIGTGTQSTTGNTFPNPYIGNGQSNRQQYLYTAAELTAMGISPANIESIAFNIANLNFMTKLEGVQIKMGHTSSSSLTTWETGLSSVFYASIYPLNYPTGNLLVGWNTHTLQSPFAWNGNDNLVVEVCYSSYSFGGANPSVRYTTTTSNMAGYVQQNGACTSGSMTVSNMRPNIRIKTAGAFGCTSLRKEVKVNVPSPNYDIIADAILAPNSACALDSSEVILRLINHGLNTINGGLNASFKVDNGSFITPENINTIIYPGDTLNYTFQTKAYLPSGSNGMDYEITAVASLNGDMYHPNDTVVKDSIRSDYQPNIPVVITPVQIGFGQIGMLTASSNDTVYWYTDSLGVNEIGFGSPYNAGNIYDTTTFYVRSLKTIPPTPFDVGTATNLNTNIAGPSPFGAQAYTAWGLKNQYLILASELQAIGMIPGEIEGLAFNVNTPSGTGYYDFTISVGTSSQSELLSFESGLSATTYHTLYSDTAGWNEFMFNQPIYWDGVSNLVVQTCFKNTAWVTSGYALAYYTPTTFVSSLTSYAGLPFSCADTVIDQQYYKRPNIRFIANGYGNCYSDFTSLRFDVTSFPPLDAGIQKIVEPTNISSISPSVASPVKVVLKNYGTNTLSSVQVNWSDKGSLQSPFNWTGNLLQGEVDTILLSNHLFIGGQSELKVWTSLPNNLADTIPLNDTASVQLDICMGGIYSIGSNKDFSTIQSAFDDLILSGVCSDVVFNIDSGQYVEQLSLPEISGAGPNATITFQSLDLDSSFVEIIYAPLSAEKYTLELNGADYIILKQLTVKVNGGSQERAIQMQNGCSNNTITHCRIIGPIATHSSSAAIHCNFNGNNNNRFEFNDISRSANGIYANATSNGTNYGISIEGNKIHDITKYGIYAFYQDSAFIHNNEISNDVSLTSSVTGIFFQSSNGSHRVTNNKVILDGGGSGTVLRYQHNYSSASDPAVVANNFLVRNNSTGITYGIEINGNQNVGFYHNSIRIGSGNNTSTALKSGTSGSAQHFKNNIFSNFGIGYAIHIANTSPITTFDYNNIYTDTTSGAFAYWVAAANGLTALKQFSGTMNQNSISLNPGFIFPTDLHTTEILMNASGTPVAQVTDDIDGDVRNASNPDIGADEFTPAPFDAGAIALMNPLAGDCFDDSMQVIVRIKNYGLNTLDFSTKPLQVNVNVTGSGVIPPLSTTINSGVLPSAASMDVVVNSSFNMSTQALYTFDANTSAIWDTTTINDAMMQVSMEIYPTIKIFPFDEDFETSTAGSGSPANPGIIENGWVSTTESTNMHWYPKTGGTSSTNTGPQGDHTTGTGVYVYLESSYGTQGSSAMLTSTCVDLSSFLFPVVKFYYHMYGSSTGTLYVEAMDSLGNFIVLDSLLGQQQTASADPWLLHSVSLAGFTDANTRVRFRAKRNGNLGDIALDDILILEPSNIDLGVKSIIQPVLFHAPTGSSKTLEVEIENYGTLTLDTIPLAYSYGGTVYRDTSFVSLAPNNSMNFTFSTPLGVILANQELKIYSEVIGDINQSNDSVVSCFVGIPTLAAPWSDDFDNIDYWAAACGNGQWERGIPSAVGMNTAHSGQNSWATSLTGDYQNNADDHLYSPYFTITGTDTATLSFWHWVDTEANTDFGTVEYSSDGGVTWPILGYIAYPGSVNWFNANVNGVHSFSAPSTGWQFSSIPLDPVNFNSGNSVQFRFKFHSNHVNNNYEGWMIDDFMIDLPQNLDDVGISSIDYPITDTAMGAAVTVMVTVENFGLMDQDSIPISLSLNGGLVVTDTIFSLIPASTNMTYSFSLPYTVPSNIYEICTYTALAGDMNLNNDTICKTFGVTPGLYDVGISCLELSDVTNAAYNPIIDTVCYQHDYEVTVCIVNYGLTPATNIPVELSANLMILANEVYSGTIQPFDTADYTFQFNWSAPIGSISLCATAYYPSDVNLNNDQYCRSLIGVNNCGVGVGESELDGLILAQNRPNPANQMTYIEYSLPGAGKMKIQVTNMLGQVMFEEIGSKQSGSHQLELDVKGYSSGVYYYSLEFDGIRLSRKMIITK